MHVYSPTELADTTVSAQVQARLVDAYERVCAPLLDDKMTLPRSMPDYVEINASVAGSGAVGIQAYSNVKDVIYIVNVMAAHQPFAFDVS